MRQISTLISWSAYNQSCFCCFQIALGSPIQSMIDYRLSISSTGLVSKYKVILLRTFFVELAKTECVIHGI